MTECLFCRIAAGDVPADLLYEDAEVVAFPDINPQAPVHILVVPRRHLSDLTQAANEDPGVMPHLASAVARVAAQGGVAESGYRTVINTGPDAQQSVQHLHVHVLGGRTMGWPPG